VKEASVNEFYSGVNATNIKKILEARNSRKTIWKIANSESFPIGKIFDVLRVPLK